LETNTAGFDEVHLAALSRNAAIIGGGINPRYGLCYQTKRLFAELSNRMMLGEPGHMEVNSDFVSTVAQRWAFIEALETLNKNNRKGSSYSMKDRNERYASQEGSIARGYDHGDIYSVASCMVNGTRNSQRI